MGTREEGEGDVEVDDKENSCLAGTGSQDTSGSK